MGVPLRLRSDTAIRSNVVLFLRAKCLSVCPLLPLVVFFDDLICQRTLLRTGRGHSVSESCPCRPISPLPSTLTSSSTIQRDGTRSQARVSLGGRAGYVCVRNVSISDVRTKEAPPSGRRDVDLDILCASHNISKPAPSRSHGCLWVEPHKMQIGEM